LTFSVDTEAAAAGSSVSAPAIENCTEAVAESALVEQVAVTVTEVVPLEDGVPLNLTTVPVVGDTGSILNPVGRELVKVKTQELQPGKFVGVKTSSVSAVPAVPDTVALAGEM
jgi:N-methylhydantoinase B/oxoprolinase/acetone carboxylase alpha subunit